MLIITGFGRTGTSVLAALCCALGFPCGGGWNSDVDAGYEDADAVWINYEFYTAEREHRLPDLDECRRRAHAIQWQVLKSPRLMYSRTAIAFWKSEFPDLRVLLTHRTPEDVIASRQRLTKKLGVDWRDPKLERTHPDHYRIDLANFVEDLLVHEVPVRFLLYPHFVSKPQHVFDALIASGLPVEEVTRNFKEAWDKVIDPQKVHIRSHTCL